jgi:hypothetical protein
MKQQANYGGLKQQGIALPIIMVILLLAALVTIYTANTSVKEQQVTADQYRSEQAFAAAQAGVDDGLKRHNDYPELDNKGDPVGGDELDVVSGSGFSMGSYKVMFCDIWDDDGAGPKSSEEMMQDFLTDDLTCTNPLSAEDEADGFGNDSRVGILSVGKPDDDSGKRTISVISAPALFTNPAGSPASPLVAKGVADINGGLTIINRYSNLTVWSGDETIIQSANAETYIDDPHNPSVTREEKISIGDPPTNAILASSQEIGNNADIIDYDYNLASLKPEDLFEGYFSDTLVNIKRMAEVYTIANVPDEDRTGLIWLDVGGTSTIHGDWGDCTQNPPVQVLLVIEANTAIINDAKICGLVFVLGEVKLNGGLEVTGAVISVANLDVGGGGATVVYDPKVLTDPPAGFRGSRGIEPGTWKDWGWDGN